MESWRRKHRGEIEASGRHLEASGRHLGGIWEASGETRKVPEAVSGLEGSRRVLKAKSTTPLNQNANLATQLEFSGAFPRVGVTKYCKLQ